MATAEHPEALRLQREVAKLRQRNSFKDADFRHGSLLQNVMEALSKLLSLLLHKVALELIRTASSQPSEAAELVRSTSLRFREVPPTMAGDR